MLLEIPYFIDGKSFRVNKRHSYEVCGKQIVPFGLGIKEMNGKKCTSNWHLH